MTTIATALTSLQARGYGSDTSGAQTDALRRAYERLIRMRRWDWLIVRQTVNLPPGSSTIPFSALTNYSRMRGLHFTDYEDPNYLDYDDFYNWTDEGATTGIPTAWTLSATSIVFDTATPSNVTLSVQVDYISTPTAWASIGVGDLPVPEQLIDWMIWTAIADIAFRERDTQGRNDALNAAATIMQEYRDQHGLRQTSTAKSVVTTGFHESYTDEDRII